MGYVCSALVWHRTGTANRAVTLQTVFADNNIAKSSSVYYWLGGH
jgi:hypothetical protein